MTQEEQGRTPTPELVKMFPHGTNTTTVAKRSREQVYRGIGLIVAFVAVGLVLGLVGYMDAVARGFVK